MIIKIREKKETGFSLLELSVAVGVSAIVATAGIVASTAFIGSAQDKRDSYTERANASIVEAEDASVALSLTGLSPTNASTSTVGFDSATITWDAPSEPVDNYTILKDGVPDGTAAGNATSYTLTGLTPETTYNVTVRATSVPYPLLLNQTFTSQVMGLR